MPSPRTYATAGAFRKALEERLKRASLTDRIDLNRLRRQVAFDRLLARLFREEPAPWVLKGGYALELRFKAARSTVDIDLTLQRVVAATSSASEVSGVWAMLTLYPSLCRMSETAFHPEPSANAPWTRTTVTFLGEVSGAACAIAPRLMKVAPATGQILWRIEKVGHRSYVSGKFLYFISVSVSWVDSLTALTGSRRGQSMPVNFRIHRMNPRDGKELWEYYRPEEPVRLEFQNNLILLVNTGETDAGLADPGD